MIPSNDPINPTIVTRKQTKLKILRTIHLLVQAPILFCTKYISTGKYIANGQKFMAPNNPRTELR